ncbi:PAS domain S-box-containing protein/diguanylate cyclase (GGDEF) domain-containing protein [Lentzea albidocapillata subsp. violacea]|uniref:PAS domain S-box-containing protein/diguanylate cyclase (GGDEF) domain-containing protein n=1 Tax=Lentzea albidocapillata subsp. violacea TaxID=128104 RepID=A0A1G9QBK8_9PSEU|nr:PAS domain S-box-containing protein/diguanylate cyclase (GGDEF) domain-containing protein [Lentzea albidocapillata subsp. violacea]
MSKPSRIPDVTPSPQDNARARTTLARKWSYRLLGAVAIPLSGEDLDEELSVRLDALCSMLHEEPFTTIPVEAAGADLAALGHLGRLGLRCTTEVLGKGLLALPEFQPVERYAERIALAMGALGAGFTAANSESVLAQQESMQRSLLKAVRDANWNLKESQARFNEVVTSSTNGVLIVDLEGRLLQVNAATGQILGRTSDELTGMPLLDLIEPDFTEMLREAMTDLAAGTIERFRQSQRLLREDGESAPVTLTASLLRGADDQPMHFVVVVEDGTELALLQSELKRQSLHDVLTGLPNRQFFTTQLEIALRKADPEHGITVLHLDLDAFGMLRDSFGGRVVERYLQHVSGRLKTLLAGEKVMIARFGGDEFGVLLENTATTPGIDAIMKSINDDLMHEPTFVDGHGLSASMSAGVVHRPGTDEEPLDVLRSAERSLRRAKKGRRGQWDLFHAGQDAEELSNDALAVQMPAAWENGEITVRYRPVVRLADGAVSGVEAELHWDSPESGVLGHARCADLAEQTGLILPLGGWLLKVAGGQSAWWRQRGQLDRTLAVRLTAHQSSDADLVSRVVEVLDQIGVPAGKLMISMPGGVLSVADAADNLVVLSRMGVLTAIDDFGMAPLDFGLLASELPVQAVRVAPGLVVSRSPYVAALLPLLRERGVTVAVEGIGSAEQAEWWRAAGADFATGDHFGVAREPGEFLEQLELR